MQRLFWMVYAIAFHLIAGLFIVVALVLHYDGPKEVIIAAILGAIVTIPVAYVTAKNMYAMK